MSALVIRQASRGFTGGLALEPHKSLALNGGLGVLPTPQRLRLPLMMRAVGALQPIISDGQRVAAGECLARAAGSPAFELRAPLAGTVALESQAIRIAVARDQYRVQLPPLSPWQLDFEQLRVRAAQAGLVGLGGAVFPTHLKLAAVDTVVLNGAECEPYIACDQALLIEHAQEVFSGGLVLAHTLGAGTLIVAIESHMQRAATALLEAAQTLPERPTVATELVLLPNVYPQGSEQQLLQTVLGIAIDAATPPLARGVLNVNVATAHALWRAVVYGEPLSRRIVTVSGGGVERPQNLWAPLGAPIADLIAAAGGLKTDATGLIEGGPLSGRALPSLDGVISAATNALLAFQAAEVGAGRVEQPCIRCAACVDVCPVGLQPQLLSFAIRADSRERIEALHVDDCVECGLCSYVCPSQIDLIADLRRGRALGARSRAETERAAWAKARFEARSARLARHSAAATRVADTVASAVERARARARATRSETGE